MAVNLPFPPAGYAVCVKGAIILGTMAMRTRDPPAVEGVMVGRAVVFITAEIFPAFRSNIQVYKKEYAYIQFSHPEYNG